MGFEGESIPVPPDFDEMVDEMRKQLRRGNAQTKTKSFWCEGTADFAVNVVTDGSLLAAHSVVATDDISTKRNLNVGIEIRCVGNIRSDQDIIAKNNIQSSTVTANDIKVNANMNVIGDIFFEGGDLAEEFDTPGSAASLLAEQGTVMVLNDQGRVEPSQDAYDKRVAGIVSGAGSFRPGIIMDKKVPEIPKNERTPLALVGKAYCKVDASYSPVRVGDLLTTSPTVGHAMKADDPYKAFGSVLGKALASLKEGRGLIPVLVALQ